VRSNVSEDSGQGANAERVVLGNREVMFPMFGRGEAEVATSLTGDAIAELTGSLRKIASRQVAGKLIRR